MRFSAAFLDFIFKLRLGALIPWSVGLSVSLSVCPQKITKITKLYKTLKLRIFGPPLPLKTYLNFFADFAQ